MSFSNDLESKVIQHLVGEASWTAPTNIYVQVHDGDPGEDGTSNTISGWTTRAVMSFAAESGGAAATDTLIEMQNTSGGSATVSHVSFHDASSSGNALGSAALSASKTIGDDDYLRFPVGDLTVTLD